MQNNDFSVCWEVISALGYMVGIDLGRNLFSEKFQLSPKDYCPGMMSRNIRARGILEYDCCPKPTDGKFN